MVGASPNIAKQSIGGALFFYHSGNASGGPDRCLPILYSGGYHVENLAEPIK